MNNISADIFKNTPAMNVKLIVGNENPQSARHELVLVRPRRTLVQNKQGKNSYQ